jgi:hypothetical protein
MCKFSRRKTKNSGEDSARFWMRKFVQMWLKVLRNDLCDVGRKWWLGLLRWRWERMGVELEQNFFWSVESFEAERFWMENRWR